MFRISLEGRRGGSVLNQKKLHRATDLAWGFSSCGRAFFYKQPNNFTLSYKALSKGVWGFSNQKTKSIKLKNIKLSAK